MFINPVKRLRGSVRVPGDKSISHRAALIAALTRGRSTLDNFSTAADCQATLNCLQALGVNYRKHRWRVTVEGVGLRSFRPAAGVLDAMNSGTTMRLLTGVLAGQPFESIITGDSSLRGRPMKRVAEPLNSMGARVETGPGGCAPLRVNACKSLSPIRYRPPLASAQVKSAVLLAGLLTDGSTSVEEGEPTRDHTERCLIEFGAEVRRREGEVSVVGEPRLSPRYLRVPGDISSAAFLIAAAVMLPGSELAVLDVGLNPTRSAFVNVLVEMGADISIEDYRCESGEPVGSVRVKGIKAGGARHLLVNGAAVPSLIDELPLLAFVAAATGHRLEVRGAAELRVKESDRIRATVINLKRAGAQVEESPDGFRVYGRGKLRGASFSSFGDHRIAMACAVTALAAEGASVVEGAESAVRISFPEFWMLLRQTTA